MSDLRPVLNQEDRYAPARSVNDSEPSTSSVLKLADIWGLPPSGISKESSPRADGRTGGNTDISSASTDVRRQDPSPDIAPDRYRSANALITEALNRNQQLNITSISEALKENTPSSQSTLISEAVSQELRWPESIQNPFSAAETWRLSIQPHVLPPPEPLTKPTLKFDLLPQGALLALDVNQLVEAGRNARPADSLHKIEDIKNEMNPADRDTLDVLILERTAASHADESAGKEALIKAFLKDRLGNMVSEKGYADVLKPAKLSEALDALKGSKTTDGRSYVEQVQQLVLDRASRVVTNPAHLTEFQNNLSTFRARATQQGLTEASVAETLLHIARVLDPVRLVDPARKQANGEPSITALGMMRNAADPTAIDQGGHNTCNVNTVECRLYTREPEAAVKVVADVAVNGEFKTADNTVIRPRTLAPDGEAKAYPSPDGWRNFASQIFQVTAINIHWNRKDTLPGGKFAGQGNIHYCQGGPGEPPEYLLNASKFPPEIHRFDTIDANHPWLDMPQMSDINAQITGRPSQNFGIGRSFTSSDSNGCIKVSSLNELKDRLTKLAAERAFPIIVEVDAAKKPIGSGEGFGPHVATITHYDPLTGMVTLDNQWGKGNDMTDLPGQKPRISVAELYENMNPLPSTAHLWSQFKKNLSGITPTDIVKPSIATLSFKAVRFGTIGSAPTLLRSGLESLTKQGVPGSATAWAASETRLGRIGTRAGTALGAIGLAYVANDLRTAFKEGTGHGVGKLGRVTSNYISYELGALTGSGVARLTGLSRWAPGKTGLVIAAGVALATVVDRVGGEGIEIGAAELYQEAKDTVQGWWR